MRTWLICGLLLTLGGCASLPGEGRSRGDPWETMNRRLFAFNEAVDEAAIKPVAKAYQAVVPNLVRTGVSNFFGNLRDLWTSANLFLQVKPRQGLEMGMRVVVNTTIGLGGVLDPADPMGLERFTTEDIGQTLGFWGLKSGPYVMLPLLGPSTLRDGVGLLLDYRDSASGHLWQETRDRNGATVLQLLDSRVKLLNAGRVLDDIALDKYVLLRDAYLARRKSLVYDGDPPEDDSAPAPYKSLVPGAPKDPPK
jgi:phospholipid-binding lipoprotein MlaA